VDRLGRAGGLALACVTAAVLSSAATASTVWVHRAARPAAPPRQAVPRPVAAPPVAAPAPSRTAFPVPAFPAQFRVGAVFSLAGRPRHYCTGSVVDSPHRDLVITAAHCVHGGPGTAYRTSFAFAPGLRPDGHAAGMWQVREELAAPSWVQAADPSADVAFLVVDPLSGHEIQDVVGGNPIGFSRADGGPVQLIGYPRDEDGPVVCDGTAARSGIDQLRVSCPGFKGGTSGSPWLSDAGGGRAGAGSGSVIGVIGGYQLGGSSPDVSYSSYFDSRVRALYERAVRLS
jgi:V8-like Glu-specific endopeptidase